MGNLKPHTKHVPSRSFLQIERVENGFIIRTGGEHMRLGHDFSETFVATSPATLANRVQALMSEKKTVEVKR